MKISANNQPVDWITQREPDADNLQKKNWRRTKWTLATETNSLKKTANERRKVISDVADVAQKLEVEIKTF